MAGGEDDRISLCINGLWIKTLAAGSMFLEGSQALGASGGGKTVLCRG
jgi:hypothetical protein